MNKILSFISLSIMILLACTAFASAATNFTVSSSVTFNPGDTSKQITINNNNFLTELLNISISSLNINGTYFPITGNLTNINASSVLTITPTPQINFSQLGLLESFSGSFVITDQTNSLENATVTVNVINNMFCEYSNPGDLEISIEDVSNKGIGEDDIWYPYDTLEVEVEIENPRNKEDLDNVELEWGVISSDGVWVIEPINEDKFDLNEDEKETITFTIDLDEDLDEDLEDGDYFLYVRATGERKDTEDLTCISALEEIEVKIDDDLVILNDIKIAETPFCGATVQVTAEIINIGEDDQEGVYVMIHHTELGLNEKIEIGDIDSFKDKDLSLEFTIPKDLDEKTYYLIFDVYDDDNDIYVTSEDEESTYELPIIIAGNCERILDNAEVGASLESGGKAGKEMVVLATITNTGSDSATFTIEAADYSSWAELVNISLSSVTLNAGEEEDVTIIFNVDSDAEEDQSFSILLASEGDSLSQPISVTVEKGFSLSGLFGDNSSLWGIILLNVLLIVIIIVVAVRVARR